MAWLELHQTLPTNKKTLRLKSILKIKTPQAVGHLCILWLWALDNAQDGDISVFSADEIAEVSGWTGKDSKTFVDALIQAGFVDTDMHLHDWDEYAGRLMDKRDLQREQARIRQQRKRDKLKPALNDNADVTRDNGVNHAPIQYRTLPYPTVPNPTPERKDTKENPPDLPDDGDDVFYTLVSQQQAAQKNPPTRDPGAPVRKDKDSPNPGNPFGLPDEKLWGMINAYRGRNWPLPLKLIEWEEAHKDKGE